MAVAALQSSLLDNGMTVQNAWQSFVTQVGSDSAAVQRSSETLHQMVQVLKDQAQAISGVSLDEEAAKVMQFQQMYSACARYLATVSLLTDKLLEYL